MKTEKLFYNDSYLTKFQAIVLSSEKNGENYIIVLDKTAFYPEGGGQPSDTGIIDNAEVIHVNEKNGIIYHTVTKNFQVNTMVNCEINWDRRFLFMQSHSGEHLLSGLIKKNFGFDNMGFHMGSDCVTIDINGVLTLNNIEELERLANYGIYKNEKIIGQFPSKENLLLIDYRSKKEVDGNIRIVSVGSYDDCACCGTHVNYTGEIGLIKILSFSNYKGGMRLNLLIGYSGFLDYSYKNNQIFEISKKLSVKPYDVTLSVQNLIGDNLLLKKQINDMEDKYFEVIGKSSLSQEFVCHFEKNLSSNSLRKLCNVFTKNTDLAFVFSEESNCTFKYAIGSKFNMSIKLSTLLNENFKGRGGGQITFTQGTIFGTKDDITNFIFNMDFVAIQN